MKAARLLKGFAAFYLPAITACLNLNKVESSLRNENLSLKPCPCGRDCEKLKLCRRRHIEALPVWA
jgi:hypothetical protein